MAEWSKALFFKTIHFSFVGSNPTSDVLYLDWKDDDSYDQNRPQILYFVKDF